MYSDNLRSLHAPKSILWSKKTEWRSAIRFVVLTSSTKLGRAA